MRRFFVDAVTLEAVCTPSEDVVARDIDGQTLIIPLASGIVEVEGELFALNGTGRAIWQKLDGRRTLKEVAAGGRRLCGTRGRSRERGRRLRGRVATARLLSVREPSSKDGRKDLSECPAGLDPHDEGHRDPRISPLRRDEGQAYAPVLRHRGDGEVQLQLPPLPHQPARRRCRGEESRAGPEEIGRIAGEAAALGAVWCLVSGGEPLLREDFSAIYLSLKRWGCSSPSLRTPRW